MMHLPPMVFAAALCLGGCSQQVGPNDETSGGGDSDVLLDHAAWEPVEASLDPFERHRPPQVTCDGYWEENGQLEVATSTCNYAGLTQGLLVPLQPGDRVQTTMLHDALLPPEGVDRSEAHAALIVGETVVWEAAIEIPSEPGYVNIDAEVEQAWPAGTEAFIHLHNHGFNQYRWLAIERFRPED